MALLFSDIPVRDSFMPALGRFLSPFQGIWQSVEFKPETPPRIGPVSRQVTILYDDRDVPHIYADNMEDALYAQGYVHAANRLFSMDISTRMPAGRLSEIFGNRTLAIDRRQRERGFEYAASQMAEYWTSDPKTNSLLEAYVQGVNDYISSLSYKDWPIEYKLLSHEPVTWSVLHTTLMVTNLAITLCMSEQDLALTHAREVLSPEWFEFLYPGYNPKESPVIPSEKIWDFEPVAWPTGHGQSTPSNQKTPPVENVNDHKYMEGSNNWAVAPSRTANGHALLANDPHLNLTLPSIWYEMEIHTPDMNVHGVSFPGSPLIIIGFNDHIAWGTTNSGQDVLDWYRITWQDEKRTHYLLDGEYTRAKLREEVIEIRGAHPITDTIRYTRFGPVSHQGEYRDLAMKWIVHALPGNDILQYVVKANHAKNLEDYREAVTHFQYPAQNKVFASTGGDIAMTVAGRMPLRPAEQAETIVDGKTSASDWQGFIPTEHAPFIANPLRGYVSSANQRPVDQTYPYPVFGRFYFADYRGRILNNLLDGLDKATPQDMMALQLSNYNLHAAELLPALLEALQQGNCLDQENEKNVYRQLAGWDYTYHRDSVAPIFYESWYKAFVKMVWDELDSVKAMYPESWRLVDMATNHPDNEFFDLVSTTDTKEVLKDIACLSFARMLEDVEQLPEGRKANLGGYMETNIPHISRIPVFSATGLHASGHYNALNAMKSSNGPSWKMVVEMSTPPKAWVIYPGGQSGNPASPHYRDMLDDYLEGKYYEISLRNDITAWQPKRKMEINPR